MPAHTYWRLRCPVRPGGGYTEISEMVLLDGSSVDLSVGGTASASSTYSGAYLASNAFDKSNSTLWSNSGSGDPDCWLQYQTPTPVDPVYVSVRPGSNFPGIMWLEGSDTGSAPWDRLYLLGGTPLANTTQVFTLTPTFYSGTTLSASLLQVFTPEYPTVPVTTENLMNRIKVVQKDWVHGGLGYIYGTTYLDGSPDVPVGGRRVRLIREVDGLTLRETWSNAAGYYEFRDISLDYKYTALAYDHTHDYRAVVADNLTPEVAP